MNEIFAGSAALLLSVLLWGLGRKNTPQVLKGSSSFQGTGLQQVQTTLIRSNNDLKPRSTSGTTQSDGLLALPTNKRERLELQRQLTKAMAAGPEERLEAIQIAEYWGHSSVLKILRQGLRDSDSRVVTSAAVAISKYRGRTLTKNNQEIRPPRNVALMR